MGSRGSGYEASGTGGGSGSSEYDDIITKGDGTEYYYNSKTGEMWLQGAYVYGRMLLPNFC